MGVMLTSWLTLALLPMYEAEMYSPPDVRVNGGSAIYTEFGADAYWGPLFAGGALRVVAWPDAESGGFWPCELDSLVNAGFRLGNIEIGWRHSCSHPVTPYLGAYQYLGWTITPHWDSGFDEIYLTIGQRR